MPGTTQAVRVSVNSQHIKAFYYHVIAMNQVPSILGTWWQFSKSSLSSCLCVGSSGTRTGPFFKVPLTPSWALDTTSMPAVNVD